MKIGLLGGTGIEAKGLALRFAAAGTPVIIGSRSEDRATLAAREYNSLLGNSRIQGASNQSMIDQSDMVILTVGADHILDALHSVRLSQDQVLVDVSVPMKVDGAGVDYVEPPLGSNAERIDESLGGLLPVVGAFKTIPAHILADLQIPLDCNVFICGDSDEAKNRVALLAEKIPSLRPLDAGPLRAARTLERMTVLAVHLNRRYKRRGARFLAVGI
jgi:NADPH-dependent F420 reductase